ncbi:glycogen synthase [Gracilibacillus kekensis]|uniref:Glycogen synthase n=1 Tax=Gracilibacillus kekensis TaxID=1027249 RepID=A0A1M7NU90_9BACI|nr:glycogen/starch synthase [Gracilibacillus kekensis]SHN07721.1 starch synthase [Gracilibacillus kekensis]
MGNKILFVASECTPFVKTGGLADVIGSLPQALTKTNKYKVSVILPFYKDMIDNWSDQMEKVTSFTVEVGWREHKATVFQLIYRDISYLFIGNDYYFSRNGIYGYEDDGERFVFFCQAVVETITELELEMDILHAHDWQAGLAIAFAKITLPSPNLKTVFTIHNIKYQGIMQKDAYQDLFNTPPDHIAGMEWNGLLNCMKAGIFHADKITTVSPTYAEELKTPYFSEGLHPMIMDRHDDFVGILNGIDLKEYSPLLDPHLPSNYLNAGPRKQKNKEILQQKLGLRENPEMPLYVMITRLVEQKGLHLIQAIIDEFLHEDVQFVLLGTGDDEFHDFFYHAEQRHKGKMVSYLGFDEAIARQLYAASDFFVMPSLFEPCGLAQLIALQYRSVPIVRETGGLKDTVTPFNEFTQKGNGFSFSNYNAHELLHLLKYSLTIYHNQQKWHSLMRNVNDSHFSWEESAIQYAELYRSLTESESTSKRSETN